MEEVHLEGGEETNPRALNVDVTLGECIGFDTAGCDELWGVVETWCERWWCERRWCEKNR